MAPRLPLLRRSLLRPLLSRAHLFPTNPSPLPLPLPRIPSPPRLSPSLHLPHPSPLPFFHAFASSSSSPSGIVLVGSDHELNAALNRVQDEGLDAIFYFTAVWCGPCKFIAPTIEEMSKKFPHAPVYKIDIDQEGLGATLSKLKIYSVPTFHFFQKGKKAAEVVGANVTHLKETMENLYK